MKKIVVATLSLALIAGIALWFFNRKENITNYPPQGEAIVAFGDSLVEGVGSNGGGDFVSILSKSVGEPIINMGVAGNTTRDGLARVDEVLKKNPKIVLLLLGGNDFLRKIPREETFSNLSQIIDRIHERGALVILLGVRGGLLSDGYGEYFEDLADTKRTLYVPNVLAGLLARDEYMADSIHPNNAGYAIISAKILPALNKALQ